jgi:predicted nucleic acid-binding protein
MRQYLDTSALIALGDRRDKNHQIAKEYLTSSLEAGVRFVMGRNVLIEYIDGLTKRVGKKEAIEELKNLQSSRVVAIENPTEGDWEDALKHFEKYSDKRIDLTDCLSFALMERLEIESAFTFDSDFKAICGTVP